MNIAYIANPDSIHDCKWINYFHKKHQVIVICSKNYETKKSYLKSKIKVYPVLPTYSVLNLFKQFATIKKLRTVIKKEKIAIVHSMYAVPNALWGNSITKNNHVITTRGSDILVDYLQTYHSPNSLREKISYYFMKMIIKKALNKAVAITSTSFDQKKEIEKLINKTEKLHLVRTGVDTNKFSDNHLVKRIDNKFIIFSPRSMKPIYNIDLLIQGVNEFRKSKAAHLLNVELQIIDDRPQSNYSKYIHKLISDKKLDHFVKILPKLTQTDMLTYYRNCNLVIMIPTSDGTPVSAIESMLLKKTLILGNLHYDKDIFNKNTVWKVRNFSREAIKNSITEVITNERMAERKIENAYRLASEKANLQNSLAKIASLYENILWKLQ